jgi:hypothetical protein
MQFLTSFSAEMTRRSASLSPRRMHGIKEEFECGGDGEVRGATHGIYGIDCVPETENLIGGILPIPERLWVDDMLGDE